MKKPYLNPYLAGFILGLVLLASYLIAGRGLGASGAFSSIIAGMVNLFSPEHAQTNPLHARYLEAGLPHVNWLVYLVFGSILGAIISAFRSGRFFKSLDKGPQVTIQRRIFMAVLGGSIAAIGAKIAKGCTSGQALSGSALLSVGGLLFMLSVFTSAYLMAWIFKKEWLK